MNAAVDQLLEKKVAASAPATTPKPVAAANAPAVLIDEASIARAMRDAQQVNRPVIAMPRRSRTPSTIASSPVASSHIWSRTSRCCHPPMPRAGTAWWCTKASG
jgi:hypothetical protein